MIKQLTDYINYRGDRLFEGAVDVSWLMKNREKSRKVAETYIFHGPEYHGVDQNDTGLSHDHKLVDTATFLLQIIRRCNGREDKPFTLAIAGYGTGKSHLATTLSILLSEPSSATTNQVLENLGKADSSIQEIVKLELAYLNAPALVITLNGAENFDLAEEFTKQTKHYLYIAGIDTHALDSLRPRFKIAANLTERLTSEEAKALTSECGLNSLEEVINQLNEYNEAIYSIVHNFLLNLGFSIKAIGDETVKDVIDTICQEYVGEGRPFGKLVVIFDEFGRYAEFATVRSHIAGSGVLQQLYEGIQANSDKVIFFGFIQFDLNTYVQRIGQEYRNEILRVSTRYQTAEKAYLSINLETLLAHLLEKSSLNELEKFLDTDIEKNKSKNYLKQINSWFPQSNNHQLWSKVTKFHHMIRIGCWPLSPFTVWLLFYLSAAGQHLEQRSAISLLAEAFKLHHSDAIPGYHWQFYATDIWSTYLENELCAVEERGNSGSITQIYRNVIAKVGQYLADNELKTLRAIVLSSKLGLVSNNRQDASEAIAELTGLHILDVKKALETLENERNVLSWDERFNQFEIIGDTVTRPQFLKFLRQIISEKYDTFGKSQLFSRKAVQYCANVLGDQECDFAEKNNIFTNEWIFNSTIANIEELPRYLEEAIVQWRGSFNVDQPRGKIIYCYVDSNSDIDLIRTKTTNAIRSLSQREELNVLPILVVFLYDEDGTIGQCIAELTVLDEDLDNEEKSKFGNLIKAHRQKCEELLSSKLEDLIKQRHYSSAISEDIKNQPLRIVCTKLFESVYSEVLPFPFDGYSTIRGNAADSCYNFTLELMHGNLSYQNIMTKAIREKNRANEVLKNCWQIFLQNGDVSKSPSNKIVRNIFSEWEKAIGNENNLVSFADLVKIAIRPPYGANIASGGLLLGVYLCARKDSYLIRKDNYDINLPDITNEMLFRGKQLDIKKLEELYLCYKEKEKPSEWNILLDEWETALNRSYNEQIEYFEKSSVLEIKIPVPKSEAYRLNTFREKAQEARIKLIETENKVNKALDVIESSKKIDNLHKLTYGAVKLKEIVEMYKSDTLLPQNDGYTYQDYFDSICQKIILLFDSWLINQNPRGRSIKSASEFEHYMRETSSNLKKIELNDLAEKVDAYTLKIIREINEIISAKTYIDKIDSWLAEVNSNNRSPKIIYLRNSRDIAREYLKKLTEFVGRKIVVPGLKETQESLNKFIIWTDQCEKDIRERFCNLLDVEFESSKIREFIQETEDLEKYYEGCESDIQELRIIRKVIMFYEEALNILSNKNLLESSLKSKYKEIKEKAKDIEKLEPPWLPDDILPVLYDEALLKREKEGINWLENLKKDISCLQGNDISYANNVHNVLQNLPPFLTEKQRDTAYKFREIVEEYLNKLKIDWLVSKYKELDTKSKKAFLEAIGMKI
jgi:hypothetical protein